MTEQQKKQQEESNARLKQLMDTNNIIQAEAKNRSDQLMTAAQKIAELENQKPNIGGYLIAIVILTILAVIGFVL